MKSSPFPITSKNNSGQMMSKLVSDLFEICRICTTMGRKTCLSPSIKIAGSFVFLFLINARLALPLAMVVSMYVRFLHTPERPDA